MHALKQYIKDQDTIFITRNGSKIKIVDIDDDDSDEYPLVANIIGTDTEIWLTASGSYYSEESVIKEHNYDIVDYEKPEQQGLNVGEIYRLHPDAIFITRGGTKVKVTANRPYVAVVEALDGKMTYSVDGTTGIFISPDKPDPLDIVDYEKPEQQPQPTTFTVGEYVTRDGRKAIVHYDLSEKFKLSFPLYGCIEGSDNILKKWDKNGMNIPSNPNNSETLIGPWVEPPYIITVNGKEFHPVKNPKNGEKYFYLYTATQTIAQSSVWNITNPTCIDVLLANLNLIYRTKEEAQAFLDEITKPNAEIKCGGK